MIPDPDPGGPKTCGSATLVLVLDLWFRNDKINNGNFFRSVHVENMKTDHSIIYITTHGTELNWICHVYTLLQTEMKLKTEKFFCW
jgi:hypothetical protein